MKCPLLVVILLVAVPGDASAGGVGMCLGPGTSEVLESLSQLPALKGGIPSGYRLNSLDAGSTKIEMGYVDGAGNPVNVVLTLAPSRAPLPTDGDEDLARFDYAIVDDGPRVSEGDRAALLGVARMVGRAIPRSVLRYCGAAGLRPAGEVEITRLPERRLPTAFGIGAGAFQVLVVVAALLLGLMGSRRGRRRTTSVPERNTV